MCLRQAGDVCEVEITSQVIEEVFQVLAQCGIQDYLLEADRSTVEEMLRMFCRLAGLRVKDESGEKYKT